VHLTIPSLAIRPDWVHWLGQDEAKYSQYPFLRAIVARIEATFTGLPWHVDIGAVFCPYCQAPLVAGEFHAVCDQCGSDDLELTDQCFAQVMGPWPPVV
jgi:hypothetical protein